MKLKGFIVALAALAAGAAWADATPVGLWRSVDDKTGLTKVEIRIVEKGGVLTGHIARRVIITKANGICDACKDDRKDKPLLGLEIIRGARLNADGDSWDGGTILDPENGREYDLKMRVKDDKLHLRGSIGPFFRTQVWTRAL